MCITATELNIKVADRRSLKALLEETEQALKAIDFEIIGFMTENNHSEYIGPDFKATYKPQTRSTLDKQKLEADLGSLAAYEKVTEYNVLRIK